MYVVGLKVTASADLLLILIFNTVCMEELCVRRSAARQRGALAGNS